MDESRRTTADHYKRVPRPCDQPRKRTAEMDCHQQGAYQEEDAPDRPDVAVDPIQENVLEAAEGARKDEETPTTPS